ncbi:MAG: PKD domain-containing protein [Bacteroidota bacterium]
MKAINKIHLYLFIASFFVSFNLYAQPGSPTCVGAEAAQITLPFFQANLTNCGFNNFTATNTPVCGNSSYLSGQDRLYAFTPLESGFVITSLTTASTITDIGLMMFRGCPTSGSCVGNANGDGGTRIMQGEVIAGETYYVLVSTWSTPLCMANYSLRISLPGGALQGTPKVDCIAATPICSLTYSEGTMATNEGNPPFDEEINSGPSCLGSGEKNGNWYSFTVTQLGSFTFIINPNTNSDDYDWALYDITSYTCADIYTRPELEVRCDYSGSVWTDNGNTGLDGRFDPDDTEFDAPINLASGRNFMLYISNFEDGTSDGYTITLGGTADIFDDEGPTFKDIIPATCGDSTLIVNFTEPIDCGADVSRFRLVGPAGVHNINQNYTSPNCLNPTAFTFVNNLTVKFSPPITAPGVYTFTAQAGAISLIDKCGNNNLVNPSQPSPIVTFTIAPLITTATQVSSVTCFGFSNGVATAVVPSSIVSYTYLWNTTPAKTTKAVSALAAGTYSVVVTSPAGCSALPATAVINEPAIVPTPTLPFRALTYCLNSTPPVLIASFTGSGTGTVNWWPTRVGGGPPSTTAPRPTTNALGIKKYYVSQTVGGCQSVRDSIIVEIIDYDKPYYNYNPREYCLTGATNPTPVFGAGATLGGTFTSGAGLQINASTGIVNLSTSSVGAHVVKYSTPGSCAKDSLITLTILAPPNPEFEYPITEFCPGDVSLEKVPAQLNDVGVFTSLPTGVVFEDTQGTINLKNTPASAVPYIITNTIAPSKGCALEKHDFQLGIETLPKVDFTADTFANCFPLSTNFKAITSPAGGTYYWTFGDGDSSSIDEPFHLFKDTGSYVVKLVYGKPGCSSSVEKTATSHPLPIAEFVTSPEPGVVGSEQRFIDESIGATKWFWSFGDAGVSEIQSPLHTYNNDGEFEIIQIVESANGCRDTTSYKLMVENLISVFFPKSFTPNGDTKNEVYEVKVSGINPNPGSFELSIFNRWGVRVYYSTDYATHAWDGGSTESDNLYIMKLTVQDKEGNFYNYKGTITVIK